MGLLSFIKTAGEKLFGKGEAQAAQQAASADPSPEKVAAANQAAAQAILTYIETMQIDASGVSVEFDAAESAVTVSGQVADQSTKEKILLCCGNVHGVGQVNDMLTVAEPADEAQYYTVVSGDSLSKIAKEFYGDASVYNAIFEANRPMLSHPDKIYPGQMLRIPAEA
jgi:nucleoid-associated protein YgaU